MERVLQMIRFFSVSLAFIALFFGYGVWRYGDHGQTATTYPYWIARNEWMIRQRRPR